jgi:hypothetical protein
MTPYLIDLTLECRAPILSAANGAIALGLDTAMQRDDQHRPALPGNLIKGNLRQAWQAFKHHAKLAPPSDWLGHGSAENSFEPQRARLTFSPWWSDQDWQSAADARPLYRIQIDEGTGAAKEGALQVIESPYPVGRTVRFSGQVHAWLDADEEPAQLCRWLEKGLWFMARIGANKGQGFGRIESVSTDCQPLPKIELADLSDDDRLGLSIKPLGPFCIGKPAIGENNRFDSETFIPGAAILGALARAMKHSGGRARWSALHDHIDQLRVSHALPFDPAPHDDGQVVAPSRPLELPLSLTSFQASPKKPPEILDLSPFHKPALISRDGTTRAPCFQLDWKDIDRTAAEQKFRVPQVEKRLDLHTAVDQGTGAAQTGQLFSMEAVEPKNLVWLANVDFGQIPTEDERSKVRRELLDLLGWGLDSIGKHKTRCQVTTAAPIDFAFPQRELTKLPLQAGQPIQLHLQSPALLLLPDTDLPTTGGGAALHRAYAEAWGDLSDHSLELSHFFALQDPRGGRHWWHRFGEAQVPYYPVQLTRPGSVFVFAVKDLDKAAERLAEWQRYGLPQRQGAPGGEDWQRNPWIRQNGYGEIALDPALPVTVLPSNQWQEFTHD